MINPLWSPIVPIYQLFNVNHVFICIDNQHTFKCVVNTAFIENNTDVLVNRFSTVNDINRCKIVCDNLEFPLNNFTVKYFKLPNKINREVKFYLTINFVKKLLMNNILLSYD